MRRFAVAFALVAGCERSERVVADRPPAPTIPPTPTTRVEETAAPRPETPPPVPMPTMKVNPADAVALVWTIDESAKTDAKIAILIRVGGAEVARKVMGSTPGSCSPLGKTPPNPIAIGADVSRVNCFKNPRNYSASAIRSKRDELTLRWTEYDETMVNGVPATGKHDTREIARIAIPTGAVFTASESRIEKQK